MLPLWLPLGGCRSKLDVRKLEGLMKAGVMNKLVLPAKDVKCPDEVVAKKGDTFECICTLKDGTTIPIKVVQNDDKGDVTWAPELDAIKEPKKKGKGD
jgi:hypothetical protein